MIRDVIEPGYRQRGAETSKAAARRALAFAMTHRDSILGVLWRPMHCYDIAKLTGIDHVAVARRMSELCKMGDVIDSGLTAAGPNGLQCTLWRKVIA